MTIKKMNLKSLNAVNAEGKRESFTFRIDESRNEYIGVEEYWIRNFGKPSVSPIDINNLYDDKELNELFISKASPLSKRKLLFKTLFSYYTDCNNKFPVQN
jgi:hypothetical protein